MTVTNHDPMPGAGIAPRRRTTWWKIVLVLVGSTIAMLLLLLGPFVVFEWQQERLLADAL